MAPSSGTMLLPKAMKVLKSTLSKTHSFVRSHLLRATLPEATLQPILSPLRTSIHHPTHPLAAIRNSKRHLSTTTKRASTHPSRASLPTSTVSRTLARQHITPFASPLRPNLTTGTLSRTANGGARAFSSAPISHAQVVNNVSAAVRAFWTQGGRAQYDGVDPVSGGKRFRQVSATQEKAMKGMTEALDARSRRGATVSFRIAPTVTAFSPFVSTACAASKSFETEFAQSPVLDTPTVAALGADFARALKDFAAVMADLNRLARLGDLPLEVSPDGATLRVRFPGCDADAVERLCDEVGVLRGVVREDDAWTEDKEVEMALLFPFAPSREESDDGHYYFEQSKRSGVEWQDMLEPTMSTKSVISEESEGTAEVIEFNPWEGEGEGYESLGDSDYSENDSPRRGSAVRGSAVGYEGIEGIYRFLSEIDGARR